MALSKQQQQQIFLGVIFVVGFIYVYWNYCLKPTNEKIAATKAQLEEVQDKVENMKRTANRLPALQKEYDNLVTEVGKAEKRLPKQRNLEEILRIITEQSIKQHVTISSFSPENERPQNYFVEIPYSLKISGSFHTLGKFLAVVGQQERILSARNLQLSYTPNAKRGYTVSGTFTLLAYIFKG